MVNLVVGTHVLGLVTPTEATPIIRSRAWPEVRMPCASSDCFSLRRKPPDSSSPADSVGSLLGPDGRPGPAGEPLGQGGNARFVLEHAGRRPHRLPGAGRPAGRRHAGGWGEETRLVVKFVATPRIRGYPCGYPRGLRASRSEARTPLDLHLLRRADGT